MCRDFGSFLGVLQLVGPLVDEPFEILLANLQRAHAKPVPPVITRPAAKKDRP